MEFQTEKPAISYIHFDFFYCLAHTFNAIEILDKREFFLTKRGKIIGMLITTEEKPRRKPGALSTI